MGRPRTEPPTCHPDRPHQAKGLCGPCYFKQYDDARRERRNAANRKDPADYAANYRKPPFRPPRMADCHPDRKHCARGLCRPCWQRGKRDGVFVTGMATCHPDRPACARGLCHKCYAKKKYWGDPEKYKAVQRSRGKADRERNRREMLEAYGGKCACPRCPETNPAFLCLDHENGDGGSHRVRVGRGHVLDDLRRQGWPQEGYRLLCWNCNSATRFGRTCPHMEADAA